MIRLVFIQVFLVLSLFANGALSSISQIDFSNFQIQKGLDNLTADDFDNAKLDGLNQYFSCPDIKDLKDLSILKKKFEIKLANIDFVQGSYSCIYSFANGSHKYILNFKNKEIQKEYSEISSLKSLPKNITLKNNFGLYKLDEGLKITDDTLSVYKELAIALKETQRQLDGIDYKRLDLKNSINSYRSHEQSIASKLTGLLMLDNEFLEGGSTIKANGELNFKTDDAAGITQNQSPNEISNLDELVNITGGLDLKFWGFYNYLINNIYSAWSSIIITLFGASVVGYSFISVYKQHFSFKESSTFWVKRGVGIFAALVFFSAPIVPQNISVPDEYQFGVSTQKSTEYTTAINTLLRYMFQTGTYFANKINDTAIFSYVKYVGSEYGTFDTKSLKDNYMKDVANFLANTKTLEHKINFFEATCAKNYSHLLLSKGDLVSYKSVTNAPIVLTKQFNDLSYNYVDYETCSSIFTDVREESSQLLMRYKNMISSYSKIADKLLYLKSSDMEEFDKWASYVINMNNKYGWLSVAMMPSMTHVLQTKQIFNFAENVQDIQEDINDRIGQTIPIKSELKKTVALNEELYNQDFKEDEGASWFVKIYKLLGGAADSLDSVPNFFNEYIIGPAGGKIIGTSMYFMMPGFNEMYHFVEKLGFIDFVMEKLNKFIIVGKSMLGVTTGGFYSALSGGLELISMVLDNTGKNDTFAHHLLSFILAVMLYTFIITAVTLVLVSLFIVLKIIFYHTELIVTLFVSIAMMFYSLAMKENQQNMFAKFFVSTIVLSLTPLSIVLSVYVYMATSAILRYLWDLCFENIFRANIFTLNTLDSNTMIGTIEYMKTYAVDSLASIIFNIVNIFLAYMILFKFHEQVLSKLGLENTGAISLASKMFDSMQYKISKV